MMLTILSVIIVLSLVFWVLSEAISAMVGLIFTLALMVLVIKLWKDIFK